MKKKQMFFFNVSNSTITQKWFIDSSASSHITNKRFFFTSFIESWSLVELVDRREVHSLDIETEKLTSLLHDGTKSEITVMNILYVPELVEVKLNHGKCNINSMDKIIVGEYNFCTNSFSPTERWRHGAIVTMALFTFGTIVLVTEVPPLLSIWRTKI